VVPGNVLLKKGEGNLPNDSVVNISQVITVNKSDLTEKIRSLPPAKLKETIEGVKLLIEPREL
jgi:mRNA interferase MazF